jgi:DNA-binding CsgD family transcriptional regulator
MIEPFKKTDSAKVVRGKIVAHFIRAGWRPPALTGRRADRLIDDMTYQTVDRAANVTLALSPSETRVLQLSADGGNEGSSAKELGVGRETIKSQTKAIRSKLAANTLAHAVAIGLRRGLIV